MSRCCQAIAKQRSGLFAQKAQHKPSNLRACSALDCALSCRGSHAAERSTPARRQVGRSLANLRKGHRRYALAHLTFRRRAAGGSHNRGGCGVSCSRPRTTERARCLSAALKNADAFAFASEDYERLDLAWPSILQFANLDFAVIDRHCSTAHQLPPVAPPGRLP